MRPDHELRRHVILPLGEARKAEGARSRCRHADVRWWDVAVMRRCQREHVAEAPLIDAPLCGRACSPSRRFAAQRQRIGCRCGASGSTSWQPERRLRSGRQRSGRNARFHRIGSRCAASSWLRSGRPVRSLGGSRGDCLESGASAPAATPAASAGRATHAPAAAAAPARRARRRGGSRGSPEAGRGRVHVIIRGRGAHAGAAAPAAHAAPAARAAPAPARRLVRRRGIRVVRVSVSVATLSVGVFGVAVVRWRRRRSHGRRRGGRVALAARALDHRRRRLTAGRLRAGGGASARSCAARLGLAREGNARRSAREPHAPPQPGAPPGPAACRKPPQR
jgi:hypothetical protein